MRRHTRFLCALFVLALSSTTQTQDDSARFRQQFLGSYRLISFTNIDAAGKSTLLPYAGGQISYDASGRMSAQLMRRDRERLSASPSEAARAAAFSSYTAYFGGYTIDAAKRTVTHHVEGAVSPNMVGSPLVRHFEFSGDNSTLTLTVKDGERVTGKLQWERYR